MPNSKIFPTRDDERNVYFNNVIPYLVANKLRLLLSAGNEALITQYIESWNEVFPKAKDINLSTRTLRDQKDGLIEDIEETLRDVYKNIPEGALTESDRNTLNLKERDPNNTPRPVITEAPFAKVTGTAGGLMEYILRTDADSSRTSRHPDSDGAEIVYTIGTTPPTSPADCNRTLFNSKARGIIDAGIENAGKKFYGYARWANITNKSKSGPWCQVFSAVISD